MSHSTPTHNKPYDGWLDIMALSKLPIPLHDAITEKPHPADLVIPIVYYPGDGEDLAEVPLSEWPWDIPDLLLLPAVPGKELTLIEGGAVTLWWISGTEVSELLMQIIDPSHFTAKAMYIAMKHLENKMGGECDE